MVIPEIKEGQKALEAAGIPDAMLESRLLWEKAQCKELFEKYIKRRISGEPLQYIVEDWEFYALPIRVRAGVLIPRPDTEFLAQQAIAFLKGCENPCFLELGAGSGCVSIAVAKHTGAVGTAIDISDVAILQAAENAKRNAVNIKIIKADMFGYEQQILDHSYDAILSNPPYLSAEDMSSLQKEIEYEPKEALFGGTDGLDFYRYIAARYRTKLKVKGALVAEIGSTQAMRVSDILRENGYKDIKIVKDYGKNDRVVFCRV